MCFFFFFSSCGTQRVSWKKSKLLFSVKKGKGCAYVKLYVCLIYWKKYFDSFWTCVSRMFNENCIAWLTLSHTFNKVVVGGCYSILTCLHTNKDSSTQTCLAPSHVPSFPFNTHTDTLDAFRARRPETEMSLCSREVLGCWDLIWVSG